MTWVIVAVVVVAVVDFWVVMAVLSRRRGTSMAGRRVIGWDPPDPAATDRDTVLPADAPGHGHGNGGFFGGGGHHGGFFSGGDGGGHHGGGGDGGGGGHH
ncbi:MAG TPA: hypothetical protein VF204_05090 [Streptosporangiaceae bacterium]